MAKKIMWLLAIIIVLTAGVFFFLNRSGKAEVPAGNLTITDSQARKVTFKVPTKRVVTLTNADTEVLVALGEKPLATVVNFNMSKETEAALVGVPRLGVVTAPDLEGIIAAKPDLVLAGPVPFHTALAPSLEKAGIPVAFLKSNSYRDILDRILLIGKITGKDAAAQKIVRDIESKVKQIRARYAGFPKKKIIIVWGTVASFQLASSHTFVGDLVAQVPVENMADGFADKMAKKGLGAGYVAMDMEYISRVNPDAILVVAHGVSRANAKNFIRAFEEQTAWKNLRAVREGHVYHLPSELFAANPNVRVADSVEYVGRLLYGEGK